MDGMEEWMEKLFKTNTVKLFLKEAGIVNILDFIGQESKLKILCIIDINIIIEKINFHIF